MDSVMDKSVSSGRSRRNFLKQAGVTLGVGVGLIAVETVTARSAGATTQSVVYTCCPVQGGGACGTGCTGTAKKYHCTSPSCSSSYCLSCRANGSCFTQIQATCA